MIYLCTGNGKQANQYRCGTSDFIKPHVKKNTWTHRIPQKVSNLPGNKKASRKRVFTGKAALYGSMYCNEGVINIGWLLFYKPYGEFFRSADAVFVHKKFIIFLLT